MGVIYFTSPKARYRTIQWGGCLARKRQHRFGNRRARFHNRDCLHSNKIANVRTNPAPKRP